MILGTGAMAVKAPLMVSEACGVNRGYNIPTLCQTLGLSLALLLCLCVASWGACTTGSLSCGSWCGAYCSMGSRIHYEVSTGNGCSIEAIYTSSGSRVCTASMGSSAASWASGVCGASGSPWGGFWFHCDTQAEADSVACAQNPDLPQCPHADTTYHCQNTGGAVSGGFGGPNQAWIFQCIDDVCTLQQELAGTCNDWGYCEEGQSDCDITDSTTKKVPCALSGNGTSMNGKCYYSCGNGKNYTCSSKYSTWGGDENNEVYIGQCDKYPSQTCAPDLYQADSTEQENPYTDGGAVPTDTSGTGDEIGSDETQSNLDYTKLLEAIHDTLTMSLKQHRAQTWYQWSIDSVLKNNIYYDLEQLNNYQNALNQRDIEKFTLMQETGEDIRQARSLLDSIKNFDTLNVASATDTAYTNRMDTISDRLKEIREWNDSSSNMFTKIRNWYTSMFGDSTAIAKRNSCEQVAKTCQNNTSSGAEYMACLKQNNCLQVDGGTPWDAGMNMINRGFDAIIDALFDDDSTSVPVDTTDVDTLSQSVQNLIDSLRNYDVPNLNLDSIQHILDSLRSDTSSVRINSDSLVTDTSVINQKFNRFMLPANTTNTCYILDVNLGDFGGLAKEDLKIYIDFSNFGGYNFCEIGRMIIRIMTLVVCISLTLGSWAAAFGWNKSTGD